VKEVKGEEKKFGLRGERGKKEEKRVGLRGERGKKEEKRVGLRGERGKRGRKESWAKRRKEGKEKGIFWVNPVIEFYL